MTQAFEYALLAAGAYDDLRLHPDNKSPIPNGWTELAQYAVSGSGPNASPGGSGFSAKVYQSTGGEIVISCAGTEFAMTGGGASDWISGNAPLTLGIRSAQALEAAQLYQHVKAEVGHNITFTGHSLGGGLAGIMAVWFERPAKVFAQAPFEAAATRTDALSTLTHVRDALRSSPAGIDIKLDTYTQVTHNLASAGAQANAPDWLVGSFLDDQIQGLGGNDLMVGWEGDDLVQGGDGADLLYGGLGLDALEGGGGDVTLQGGGSSQIQFGGASTDLVFDDLGDDAILRRRESGGRHVPRMYRLAVHGDCSGFGLGAGS
jgi:Ca2+-binding RTX toxin-like protein